MIVTDLISAAVELCCCVQTKSLHTYRTRYFRHRSSWFKHAGMVSWISRGTQEIHKLHFACLCFRRSRLLESEFYVKVHLKLIGPISPTVLQSQSLRRKDIAQSGD